MCRNVTRSLIIKLVQQPMQVDGLSKRAKEVIWKVQGQNTGTGGIKSNGESGLHNCPNLD
jgi:hypothetical protein